TTLLAAGLRKMGIALRHQHFFDTLAVEANADQIVQAAAARRMNLRRIDARTVGISLDETCSREDVENILAVFGRAAPLDELSQQPALPPQLVRHSAFLSHPVFNTHHSETEMLRYMRLLESRDLSLTHSMIPLGSCTMKLNATAEMLPVTWPQFGRLHPFAPRSQAQGYTQIFDELSAMLREITGFEAVSLQPN